MMIMSEVISTVVLCGVSEVCLFCAYIFLTNRLNKNCRPFLSSLNSHHLFLLQIVPQLKRSLHTVVCELIHVCLCSCLLVCVPADGV